MISISRRWISIKRRQRIRTKVTKQHHRGVIRLVRVNCRFARHLVRPVIHDGPYKLARFRARRATTVIVVRIADM